MPGANKLLRVFIVFFLFLFVGVLIPGLHGFQSDMDCFSSWAIYISQHGLSKTYSSTTDYPPIYQYVLWGYQYVAGHEEARIASRIGFLRIPTLAVEVFSLWYVYRWLDKKTDFLLLLFFSIFNIAFSYDTIVWGQVDGILSGLVFISVFYAYHKKALLSCIWFILALNFKLQSIIFLPVVLLLLFQNFSFKGFLKNFSLGVVIIVVLQLALLLPFIQTSESRAGLYKAIFGSVDRYPFISAHACNFWYWVFPDGKLRTHDSTIWFGTLSYKMVGLILFFTSSFVVLWPLLVYSARKAFGKGVTQDFSKTRLWLICSAIPLLFFFCNTQMHERYAHPAFIFLTVYAFYSRDFVPYILFSIAYFLNLEKAQQFMGLENYGTLIFDERFIAGLFCLLIVYIVFRIYRPLQQRQLVSLNYLKTDQPDAYK